MGCLLTQVSATNEATTTITKKLARMNIVSNDQRDDYIAGSVAVKRRRQQRGQAKQNLRKQSTDFYKYKSPFGKLYIRKKSRPASFSNDEEQAASKAYTTTESDWVFMPSFYPRCIQIKYLNACGKVQGSIRTYPVIPFAHPVWYMCVGGDVQGMQKLFSERQISPYCVNETGLTLLHVSSHILWES